MFKLLIFLQSDFCNRKSLLRTTLHEAYKPLNITLKISKSQKKSLETCQRTQITLLMYYPSCYELALLRYYSSCYNEYKSCPQCQGIVLFNIKIGLNGFTLICMKIGTDEEQLYLPPLVNMELSLRYMRLNIKPSLNNQPCSHFQISLEYLKTRNYIIQYFTFFLRKRWQV